MKRGWSEFVSGPRARLLTILLLTVQLGGCALDLATEQMLLMPVFCLATPGDVAWLEFAGFTTWFLLSFSWLAGLIALRFVRVRPVYWALILLIPIALAGHSSLLERQLLYCDAP